MYLNRTHLPFNVGFRPFTGMFFILFTDIDLQIKLFGVDQKVQDLLFKAYEYTINKILSQTTQYKIQLIEYDYISNVFLRSIKSLKLFKKV